MTALDAYKTRTMKAAWRPPLIVEFKPYTVVQSFDQTLTTAGYVTLLARPGEIQVLDRGTLRQSTELEGHEGNYDLMDKLWLALEALPIELAYQPVAFVRERPAVKGHRIDSSMLAGYIVRDFFQRTYGTVGTAVSIQHSRTILGGSTARNDKKEGHQALARYIPESATRQWNEHQRDAAINALAHLYDLRKEER